MAKQPKNAKAATDAKPAEQKATNKKTSTNKDTTQKGLTPDEVNNANQPTTSNEGMGSGDQLKKEEKLSSAPDTAQSPRPQYNLVLAATHNKTVVILKATEELSRAPKINLPKEIQDNLIPGRVFYAVAKITTKKIMEVPTTEIDSIQVVGMGDIL